MKKHPVLWFYILAFALSWLGWLPLVAGSRGLAPFGHPRFQVLLLLPAVGPALAAAVVTAANDGKTGVERLLRPLGQWRVGAIWLMLAVIAPALLLLAGQIVTRALGLAATVASPGSNIAGMVMATLVMSLFANTGEEVGWRGFALPKTIVPFWPRGWWAFCGDSGICRFSSGRAIRWPLIPLAPGSSA
jgi:membrane protease YdiL (CAAX protease family)